HTSCTPSALRGGRRRRPPRVPRSREEDAAAVADLCNAFERAFSDDPELESEEDILRWWRRECEGRLLGGKRELAGVAYIRRRGECWDGDGYVHPSAFGRGVG